MLLRFRDLGERGQARVGDREGFAAFVFQQLHRRRALKRLMTLPPEFDERLLAYLRGAPDTSEQGSQLLFLQLWKLGRWQEAAAHLQRLAGAAASVGAKRRLLAYAKASLISVRSYEGTKERYVEASAAVAAVDRQLGALALQSGLDDDDDDKAAPLAVGALAERLLGARKVDEVFQLLTLFCLGLGLVHLRQYLLLSPLEAGDAAEYLLCQTAKLCERRHFLLGSCTGRVAQRR